MTAYKQPDGRTLIIGDFPFPPCYEKLLKREELTAEEWEQINQNMQEFVEYSLEEDKGLMESLKNK